MGSPAGVLHVYEPFRFAAGTVADRRIDVLVPRDYDQTDRRYPVLYVNDGHTAFFPGGCDGGSWEDPAGTGQVGVRSSTLTVCP